MNEISDYITSVIVEMNPYHDGLEAETDLITGGLLDSLRIMVLVQEIEDKFDIAVEPGELIMENFQSVTAITDFITGKIINHITILT